jgi:hypothetical protein
VVARAARPRVAASQRPGMALLMAARNETARNTIPRGLRPGKTTRAPARPLPFSWRRSWQARGRRAVSDHITWKAESPGHNEPAQASRLRANCPGRDTPRTRRKTCCRRGTRASGLTPGRPAWYRITNSERPAKNCPCFNCGVYRRLRACIPRFAAQVMIKVPAIRTVRRVRIFMHSGWCSECPDLPLGVLTPAECAVLAGSLLVSLPTGRFQQVKRQQPATPGRAPAWRCYDGHSRSGKPTPS